jgi:hypothetical protein
MRKRRLKERKAKHLRVLFETDSSSGPVTSLALSDDNLAKIEDFRKSVKALSPFRSAMFASVTFTLAASDAVIKIAKQLDIPTTKGGIYFVAETVDDLDLAFAQFWELAKQVDGLAEALAAAEGRAQ